MPVIVTDALELTALLATVTVAVFWPAATVTEAGSVAAEVLLDPSVTTVPFEPAGEVKVTVAVELATPPRTDVGDKLTELIAAGLIVYVALVDVPPADAVIEAAVEVLTAPAVNVNVPVVFPEATEIDVADRDIDVLVEDSATVRPADGAAPFKVTVPVMTVPRPP